MTSAGTDTPRAGQCASAQSRRRLKQKVTRESKVCSSDVNQSKPGIKGQIIYSHSLKLSCLSAQSTLTVIPQQNKQDMDSEILKSDHFSLDASFAV